MGQQPEWQRHLVVVVVSGGVLLGLRELGMGVAGFFLIVRILRPGVYGEHLVMVVEAGVYYPFGTLESLSKTSPLLSRKNDSFPNKVSISVYNRTTSEADETIKRAKKEGNLPLYGFHDPEKGDHIIDKTSMKGTGKLTVQQAAELSIAASTIASSLDLRFRSGLKDERVAAAEVFKSGEVAIISGKGEVDG